MERPSAAAAALTLLFGTAALPPALPREDEEPPPRPLALPEACGTTDAPATASAAEYSMGRDAPFPLPPIESAPEEEATAVAASLERALAKSSVLRLLPGGHHRTTGEADDRKSASMAQHTRRADGRRGAAWSSLSAHVCMFCGSGRALAHGTCEAR